MATVANVLHYQVLWTPDKVKKAKVWKDGTMRFHTFNNHGILYDSENRVIDESFVFNQKIQVDAHLELNRTLIYIEDLQATTSKEIPPLPSKSNASTRPLYLTKPFQAPSRSSSTNPSYQQPSFVRSSNETGHFRSLDEKSSTPQANEAPVSFLSSSKYNLHGYKSSANDPPTVAPKNTLPSASPALGSISSEKPFTPQTNLSRNPATFKPPFKTNLPTISPESAKSQASKPTRVACIPVLRRPKSPPPSNILKNDPLENFDEDNIDSDFFSSPSPDYESTPPFLSEPMDAGHSLGNPNPFLSSSLSEPMLTSSGSASGATLPPCDEKTDVSHPFEKSLSFPCLGNSNERNGLHTSSVKKSPLPRLPMPRLRRPVGKRGNFSNVTTTDPSKNLYERAIQSTSMLAAQPSLPENTDPEIPNSPEFLESDNEEDVNTENIKSKNTETVSPITLPNNKTLKPAAFRPPSFVSKPKLTNNISTSNAVNGLNTSISSPKVGNPLVKPATQLHSALTKPSGPSLRTGMLIYGKYSKRFIDSKGKEKVKELPNDFPSLALHSTGRITKKPFSAPSFSNAENSVFPLQSNSLNRTNSPNSTVLSPNYSKTLSQNKRRSEAVELTTSLAKDTKNDENLSFHPSPSSQRRIPTGTLRKNHNYSPIQRFSSECSDLPFVNSIDITSTASKIKRIKLNMLRFKSQDSNTKTLSVEEEEKDFI